MINNQVQSVYNENDGKVLIFLQIYYTMFCFTMHAAYSLYYAQPGRTTLVSNDTTNFNPVMIQFNVLLPISAPF